MSEYTKLFEHAGGHYEIPSMSIEGLLRRRDRKHRNRRITAGVAGLAVFVAAVWIVRDVASLNSTRTPANQPTQMPTTQPTETGPAVGRHAGANDYSHSVPPAGTAVSTPVEGKLIAEGGVIYIGYVRVYADGRVLTVRGNIVERRLSPKGVELVRSGAVRPQMFLPPYTWADLPAGVWEDHVSKPYVPARYGACFRHTPLDVDAVLDMLPASAQALLRGNDPARNRGCLEVSPEEARALEKIMGAPYGDPSHADWPYEVHAWPLPDAGSISYLQLAPLFPNGERPYKPGG
jgi:hypothetical protein